MAKKLLINCASCDARNIREDDYAHYEAININTSALFTSPEAKAVLNRLPVSIDCAKVIELEGDVDLRTVNGRGEIRSEDAEALKSKGASFSSKEVIIARSKVEAMLGLIDERAELTIVPDGTAVVLDDITLDAAALHRHGKRLYVIGDVTVPENASALNELEYLNIRGDARVPEQHREKFLDKLADISGEVKLARPKGASIVDKPIVKVTKWMLEQQPAGIEVIDCAVVKIADDIPKELLAERLRIEDCGVVKCGEELEDTIAMVCENVGRIGGESDSVMAGLKDMMETKFINAAEYIL